MTPFEVWADKHGIRVANCAECRLPISSDPRTIPYHRLRARIKGRPYCNRCLGGKRNRRAH